jgi:transcriptional regulator with XRE-family HTH domain
MLARLREARLGLGLSQAEVGRRLGRPDQFVSKSETGERRLDPIDLWRFAGIYRQPVSAFLPAEPPPEDNPGSR